MKCGQYYYEDMFTILSCGRNEQHVKVKVLEAVYILIGFETGSVQTEEVLLYHQTVQVKFYMSCQPRLSDLLRQRMAFLSSFFYLDSLACLSSSSRI